RDGYTFKGWSGTGLDGDTNKEVTIETGSTGDRAYTANYDPFTYTVKYDANGAKGKIDDVKVQVGQAFALADGSQYTNTRTVAFESNGGSKAADQQVAVPLAGWTLGDNVFAPGQEVSNLSTKDKDTVTLKAQWADDQAVITLPSVTNGDKVLEGWYEDVTLTKKVGNPQETYAVKKDTKLYAKWKSVGFNVDNDGAVWEKGSKKPLEFTIHAEEGDADLFSHFTSLYNNKKKLNSKAFTATSGSVKLSINPDFLETLSPGRHTFTANFDDGRKADVHFTIQEAKAKKSEKTDGQKTGVNQNWLPWAAGIAVALIGVYVFRKKAKE
ncbi:MAG: InlB B-repeat-containing protein, partial [Erysipelotrichaceae bacterium]|nr:InlB B-repeat-containing protein [Erysipelotrichaceae bacterium]